MDPVLKAQWIADLRSGDYEQGRGTLRRGLPGKYEYCCLGVLCERLIKNGRGDVHWGDDCIVFHYDDLIGEEYEITEYAELPGLLLDELDWDTEQVPQGNLILKNDGELDDEGSWRIVPFTFEEIADYIESVNL